MKVIPLNRRSKNCMSVVLVSDEDFEALSAYSWRLDAYGYAVRSVIEEGNNRTIYLHRQILGLVRGDGKMVDHRNGDRLDNTRENLRICNASQNNANAKKRVFNKTGFKGVVFVPSRSKFRAYIGHKGKVKNLGSFWTAEEAHEVYCLAADMLHGEFANHGSIR